MRTLGPLWAEVRGDGPAVVLLHGNGEDARVFDALAPYLGGFRTIALEARGHGRTPQGTAPLTIAHLAKDVDAALAEAEASGLTEGPAAIVGFSDGANVALELAVHRPGRCRGLVLIGGNYRPSGIRFAAHGAILAAWLGLTVAGVVSRRARHRARVWGLMVGQPRIAEADLARLCVPTEVIGGERDLVSRSHLERMARLIPGARLVIVQGEGHMLPTAAPGVLGPLVAAFLEDLPPGRPLRNRE